MRWRWWHRSEDKQTVYQVRYLTLKELGKYYRLIYFDRIKTIEFEGEQIEVIMCYYCDDIAEHRDHVYPISALSRDILKRRITYKKLKKLPMFIVPACSRCNLLLRDRVFKTLAERQRYIKRRLKIGY